MSKSLCHWRDDYMNSDCVMIFTDQILTSIGRKFLIRNEIVNVNDSVLTRKIVCSGVKRFDEINVILTSTDEYCDLQNKDFVGISIRIRWRLTLNRCSLSKTFALYVHRTRTVRRIVSGISTAPWLRCSGITLISWALLYLIPRGKKSISQ